MQEDLISIGAKKALPFTKFLNYQLNKLRGSGVLKNVFAIPEKNCPMIENPMPITFSKIIFLFTVFVLGGTLSVIIFFVERAVSNEKFSLLDKIDDKVIALASRGPNFAGLEKRTEPETEIGQISSVTPHEFQSFLRHWMERVASQPKEKFLKLTKLEVGAILHGASQSVAIKKGTSEKKSTKRCKHTTNSVNPS